MPCFSVFPIVFMVFTQAFGNNLLFAISPSGRLRQFVFPSSVDSYLVLLTRILIFSLVFRGRRKLTFKQQFNLIQDVILLSSFVLMTFMKLNFFLISSGSQKFFFSRVMFNLVFCSHQHWSCSFKTIFTFLYSNLFYSDYIYKDHLSIVLHYYYRYTQKNRNLCFFNNYQIVKMVVYRTSCKMGFNPCPPPKLLCHCLNIALCNYFKLG